MNSIHLAGSWIIKAPRDKVYSIISDFENMPKNFPRVARRLTITKREGNHLSIDAVARTWGRDIPVRMETELRPPYGYVSENKNTIGTQGHEELLMEEVPEGTKINYTYEVALNNPLFRILGKPLIGWYAMRFWKRAVIDVLKKMLEKNK
ncbi:MAG: SRPBCC family protein [Patescibacteria group bacterium]|nr:SRPBCC family protein [Patescibacteria group bacterium]